MIRVLSILMIAGVMTRVAAVEAPAQPKVNAACSVHLAWQAPASEWFYLEGRVEKSTAGSYFMICGWNTGYFGVQELSAGRKVAIFSVWDPTMGDGPSRVKLEDRVEVLHKGEGVKVSRFGGEGTGGKSMTPFDWKIGDAVRCLVQAKVEGEKTAYAGWLWRPESRTWQHLVTFRVRTGGKSLSGLYSFVEDFRRDGTSIGEERKAMFGHGWVKTPDQGVIPLTKARFTASRAPTEAGELIDAGSVSGGLYLANGGHSKPGVPVGTMLEVASPPAAPPSDLPSEVVKP